MLHKNSTLSIVKTRSGRAVLDTLEIKVFCYLLALLKSSGDPALSIDLRDCTAACGAENSLHVLSALYRLAEEVIEEKSFDMTASIPLMRDFRHRDGAREAEVVLNELLVPMLMNIDREMLLCSSGCTTEYSRRLYALVAAHGGRTGVAQFDVPLDELRAEIGADSPSYVNFGIFRERVLDPAVAMVSETSDVEVAYEYVKPSRRIISIRFTVTRKKGWKRNMNVKVKKRSTLQKAGTDRVQALIAPHANTGKTAQVMSQLTKQPAAKPVAPDPTGGWMSPGVSGLFFDFEDEEETIF